VTARWHDDPDALRADAADRANWAEGWTEDDPARVNTVVGDATGLIHGRPPVAALMARIAGEAEALLRRAPSWA